MENGFHIVSLLLLVVADGMADPTLFRIDDDDDDDNDNDDDTAS
jgi:hypothetical protein